MLQKLGMPWCKWRQTSVQPDHGILPSGQLIGPIKPWKDM